MWVGGAAGRATFAGCASTRCATPPTRLSRTAAAQQAPSWPPRAQTCLQSAPWRRRARQGRHPSRKAARCLHRALPAARRPTRFPRQWVPAVRRRRFIIHSVGPRYNERYRTAAENALHSCYRNSMRLLKEEGLRTIAFPPLYAPRKGYPRVDAAHIALRACSPAVRPLRLLLAHLLPPSPPSGTVRRFLEHYGDGIDVTVFVTESAADHSTYQRLLPLYFPRSVEEQVAAESKLPAYTGASAALHFLPTYPPTPSRGAHRPRQQARGDRHREPADPHRPSPGRGSRRRRRRRGPLRRCRRCHTRGRGPGRGRFLAPLRGCAVRGGGGGRCTRARRG